VLKELRSNKKGVSPVIAVLLMIAIAVAAAILVYVWSMGLIGTLTTGGGQQVREQVILDSYRWPASGTLTLYLRNVGSAEVEVDAIYIAGNSTTIAGTKVLPVQGPAQEITVTPPGGTSYTSGVAYTVKIVTKTGGIFSYSVIYGSSG